MMFQSAFVSLALAGSALGSAVSSHASASSSNTIADNHPSGNLNLTCTAPLPASGYPSDLLNVYRTNYTSLVDFCSIGCSCPNSSTTSPQCKTIADFARAPDNYAIVNSTAYKVCQSNCTCASAPLNDPPASTPESCPKGQASAQLVASQPVQIIDLTCYNGTGPLFTRVNRQFNAQAAQVCSRCIDGYEDPECLAQPLPLPALNATCTPKRMVARAL